MIFWLDLEIFKAKFSNMEKSKEHNNKPEAIDLLIPPVPLAKTFNYDDFQYFIELLRKIVNKFDLKEDKKTISFRKIEKNGFTFMLNNRYILNIYGSLKNPIFYFITIDFFPEYRRADFNNRKGKTNAYLNSCSSIDILKKFESKIINAIETELNNPPINCYKEKLESTFLRTLIYSDISISSLFDHQPINETKYDLAFRFLEQYRAKNPDFRYYFRNDAPESEKFKSGKWFPIAEEGKAKIPILKFKNIRNEQTYVQLRFYVEKSKIVNVRVEFEFPGGIETTPQLIIDGDKIVQVLDNFVNYLKREVTADNKVFFGLRNAQKPLIESFSEAMDFFIGELKKLENFNEFYSAQFNKFDECLTYVNDYLNGKIRLPKKEVPEEKKYPLNQILYGPPGTGKTYSTQSKALDIIGVTTAPGSLSTTFNSNLIKGWSLKGQIAFCTFHQNFAYEDFIEGIKPITSGGAVTYGIEDGIFKKLCERAKLNPELNFVLIIDEINRGNVSSIFGELITLIEDNKREGEPNELSVILPYSKQAFSVPNNVYLIGTMNTADRSVEALDVALRRRFVFEEMLPDPKKLEGKKIAEISLQPLLETINQRLELMLDNDHTIGHAFFMNLKTEDDLVNVFKQKVIPLFQEYFFGDIKKIAMVLGSSFIKVIDGKSIKLKSSSFTKDLAEELKEKTVYKVAEFTIDAIKGILDQDTVTE